MLTATVNGIEVGYDLVGDADRTLVLIHGHPFDRSMWRAQLEMAAARDWRAIAPDLRGYGASSVVRGKTTLDVFAADIAALLDHLRIDRVVIGGLSMGGQIVMEFCRRHPERVRAVVLAATSPRADSEEGKLKRYRTADRLLAEGMEPYALEVLPKILAPRSIAAQPAVADHVYSMMRSAPAVGAAAALRGRAERSGYEATLAEITVPALIVVGDEDAFTTRDDAELMGKLLEQSELLWMEGVGHMPNLEQEREFNAALARFLETVEPAQMD